MTETCHACGRRSSHVRRRGPNVGMWCEPCQYWCIPGAWIPHEQLRARHIVVATIPEAPEPNVMHVDPAQQSLFGDAA